MLPDYLSLTRGDAPVLLSIPHAGTLLPPALIDAFVSASLARQDADWHVDRLYGWAADLGVTVLRTAISRSVIDVNRDPSGRSLYPGQVTTGLCPVETFDGVSLYRAGHEPDEAETARRRDLYFDPYQAALAQEIARLKTLHRHVVVVDAHSIRSVVPRLFSGSLPHVNIGTNGGASCGPDVVSRLETLCAADATLSWVTNGRFKGGWITRHYGRPEQGIHAIQIELAMRGYLDEGRIEDRWPPAWSDNRAAPMAALLRTYLTDLCRWAANQGESS